MLFIVFFILLLILVTGTLFSFSYNITNYSNLDLGTIWQYMRIVFGFAYPIFDLIADYMMYSIYKSHSLPGESISNVVDILYRLALHFIAFM